MGYRGEYAYMKLMFLSGSPRKHGNTARILEAVKEKIDSSHDVTLCYLPDYKIEGCLGCSKCQQIRNKPGCVQTDQMNVLYTKLMDADAILYGTPLYGHSFSGQLKIVMDRHVALFKFLEGSEKAVGEMEIFSFIGGKPVGLIVSCQGPEEDNTELVKAQFDKFCASSLTNCFGKYVFPLCDPDIKQSNYSTDVIERVVSDIQNGLDSKNK